ncbi:Aste57867_18534 [Aphanomyces stellatus]|uniref:Aste57867_18534 protein n=1 Tax=Aphanomyces stellatus TaxID=120398 RepID=A0A485LAY2_9STRA|nr:hypothetical protein As57867_018472 [Aphanomyces stellatus]VFT95270.1 Aste57867_18534 [Aphanomyces stellatus]
MAAAKAAARRQRENRQNELFWQVERAGQHAVVTRKGATIRTKGAAWNVAMGNILVDRFSVKIGLPKTKQRNAIAIGFIKEPNFWEVPHASGAVFVFNYSGWYMNVRKGSLCSIQGHDDAPFAKPFKHGDVLTVIFDKLAHTISFSQNGDDLGVAFEYVDPSVHGFFPAVISYDSNVHVSFVS